MLATDHYALSAMHRTANTFCTLAGLRGISSEITVSEDGRYMARRAFSDSEPENCGTSVHGLYDWLNRQPGVLP